MERSNFKAVTIAELQRENEVLKSLVEYGKIYVNYWSRDCDGCESYGHFIIDSLQEYYETGLSFYESLEGAGRFEVTTPDNLDESWSGGQWSN